MDRSKLSPEEKFPELAYQTWNDPRSRSRKKPMEVLVIGMMRTGTMSIKTALERLGYDGVYHMTSVMQNPPDSRMWTDFFKWKYFGEGKPFTRADWDMLLGDVEACIDVPSASAMPELIAAYPEAKVIVAERDADKWYKSYHATVTAAQTSYMLKVLTAFDTQFLGPWRQMVNINMMGMFGRDVYNIPPEKVKAKYHEMHEEVRRLVPPERRLEYQLGMGWEPICEFLDKEVPDEPFPHVNETKEFQERVVFMGQTVVRRLMWGAVPIATAAAVAGVAFVTWSRKGPALTSDGFNLLRLGSRS